MRSTRSDEDLSVARPPRRSEALGSLKLCIVIYGLGAGGAERVTSVLSRELVQRGWRVTIVTIAGNGDYYPLHPAIRRRSLRLAGETANAGDALRQNVVRIRALRSVLSDERPDVALGMMASTGVLTILASLGLGVHVVVSERIHPPAVPLGRVWEMARRLVYPLADRVIALTDESRCWLESHAPFSRVSVIPNAVVLPLPAAEPRVPPDRIVDAGSNVLLAVGRLDRQKGFDVLIDAFASIARRFPEWVVVIIGEGGERAALEERVRTLGLGDRVLLPGRAGNVADWYARADLYVLSSRFEGFPNTLVEAMAHGCPVVSFDCDTGPRDIVRHGIDGWLVRPVGDPIALRSALESAILDDNARGIAASRATEVRERFCLDRVIDEWEAALAGRARRIG
jgi:glycosyltransferase involved in cell wall biosynthesis